MVSWDVRVRLRGIMPMKVLKKDVCVWGCGGDILSGVSVVSEESYSSR